MTGNKKKIIVVGAGLAGLTAAYRLYTHGADGHVYEARGRVGDRVFSVLINGNVVKLGGENIADGRHSENCLQLINEFGLDIIKYTKIFNHAVYQKNKIYPLKELVKQKNYDFDALREKINTLQK